MKLIDWIIATVLSILMVAFVAYTLVRHSACAPECKGYPVQLNYDSCACIVPSDRLD